MRIDTIIKASHQAGFIIISMIIMQLHAHEKEISFSFDTNSVVIEKVDNSEGSFLYLTSDFLEWNTKNNFFKYPVKYIDLELPQLTRAFSLNIKSFKNDGIIDLPYPWLSISNCSFLPKDAVDLSCDLQNFEVEYPLAEIRNEYFDNHLNHHLKIAIYPIAYNPSTQKAILFNDIQLSLKYESCESNDLNFRLPLKNEEISDKFNLKPKSQSLGINPMHKNKFYIITTDYFKEDCEDLAIWKLQKGLDVELITVNEIIKNPKYCIGSAPEIVDESASIREFLLQNYNVNIDTYCFFIGDTTSDMPFRYLYDTGTYENPHGANADFMGDRQIPSYIYFSDTLHKWKLERGQNGIYTGPVYYYDYCPMIYVGRLICKSHEEFYNYFNKLKLYESFPGKGDFDYLNNGCVAQQRLFLNKSSFIKEMDINSTINILTLSDNKSESFNQTYPKGEDVIKLLGSCGLGSLQGHGSPLFVACAGTGEQYSEWRYITPLKEVSLRGSGLNIAETNNSLDLLNNYNKPGILYSLACINVPYDQYAQDNYDYNIGTSYTVGGLYGGVSFVGNSRFGKIFDGPIMEYNFGQQLRYNATIGCAHSTSKLNIDNGYSIASNNLIGDPDLNIWNGIPKFSEYFISPTDMGFNIKGENLNISKVVVYDGSNYSIPYECNLREVDFQFPDNKFNQDLFLVSIWNKNSLPEMFFRWNGNSDRKWNKKFIVRDAVISNCQECNSNIGDLIISNHSILNIYALNYINLKDSFVIRQGKMEFECEGKTEIGALTIKREGNLVGNAKTIVIKPGFSMDLGATLNLTTK